MFIRKLVLLVSMAILAIAPPLRAQDAPVSLDQWLAAFNSGDNERLERFYDRAMSDPDPLTAQNLRTETCGFDMVRTERTEAGDTNALLVERCFPALWRADFRTEGSSGKSVLDLQPYALEGSRLRASLTDLADRLAQRDEFAGALLLMEEGKEPLDLSKGAVSSEDRTAISADTPMFLASAGKMFTATAILQLVEEGRVDLDAPLSRYLPDYPNRGMAAATVRQLLSHRAGAGEDGVLRREEVANRARVRTIDDYLALNGRRAPDFPPGSKTDYSNYGFILLGAVIERVSGESYPEYIAAHVFEPAGMAHAGFPDRDHLAGIPVGYTTYFGAEPAMVDNREVLPWRGSAHGGGVASANDMLRFFRALENGTLLSEKMLALAITPGDTPWYGLGFIAQGGDNPQWGHGGGSYGMSVAAQNYPAIGTRFICLGTRDMACDRLIMAWYMKRFGLTE